MPFYSGIAIACLLVLAETVLTTGQGCEDIACPAIWSPVCGADGKTYSNLCSACGVDVACEGECPCSGGEFCGDEKCNLKCKVGEKCVENEEVQCVQAPCCPRWTCQQDPCMGKPCGAFCDTSSGLLPVKSSGLLPVTSSGLLPAILPAIRYCQPDGTCGINSKPNCTEELKEEGESCGSCFCPPTYNAGTCKPGLTCVHHPLIPDMPGTCTRTNCETCESVVQGQKCGQDGGPFRMNCTDCCRAPSQCAEWRCDAGGWLCQKTCPSEVGCEDVRKCNMAFGKGEVGVCIQTNKEGWNVKTNIDWSAPMKTGLCKSKDDTDANCCGCFKEKVDRCEDPKCVSIPKKKVERKCIKKSEDAPENFFNTGRKCQKRDDCFCFQNCKTNKKCKKSGGKCLGKPPKWPYQKAAVKPCDKKKKCSCYIPITLIIPG